jgi:hypothetical protein
MELTIVSHYGGKSDNLTSLIKMIQDKLSENLLSSFRPYEISQVHGTIIGLEVTETTNGFVSKWYLENKKKEKPIDFERLIAFLKDDIRNIVIKIGGYQLHKEYGFQSRNQHPYNRVFSFQGEIAVAMGWPIINIEDDTYTDSLYQLRKDFEKINFCHKWHKDEYKDNDFFFVLGRIEPTGINSSLLQRTSAELRNILSGIDERIVVGQESLSVIAYLDEQLPLMTSRQHKIIDNHFTKDFFEKLYRQGLDLE